MRVSGEDVFGTFFKAATCKAVNFTCSFLESHEDVEVGKDKEPKDVLLFFDQKKGLVLNSTNAQNLGEVLGDNSDDWLGARIVLYPTDTAMISRMGIQCTIQADKARQRAKQALRRSQSAAHHGNRMADIPY